MCRVYPSYIIYIYNVIAYGFLTKIGVPLFEETSIWVVNHLSPRVPPWDPPRRQWLPAAATATPAAAAAAPRRARPTGLGGGGTAVSALGVGRAPGSRWSKERESNITKKWIQSVKKCGSEHGLINNI